MIGLLLPYCATSLVPRLSSATRYQQWDKGDTWEQSNTLVTPGYSVTHNTVNITEFTINFISTCFTTLRLNKDVACAITSPLADGSMLLIAQSDATSLLFSAKEQAITSSAPTPLRMWQRSICNYVLRLHIIISWKSNYESNIFNKKSNFVAYMIIDVCRLFLSNLSNFLALLNL